MPKNRLEAFSDGVIAIIITIMVLELKVPHGSSFMELKELVPVFLSYLLSFIYIAIYWNNHHHTLHATERVDGRALWANMHLLFWLSLIPFATGWMGENHFAPNTVALYGGVLFMTATAYFIFIRALVMLHGKNSALVTALGRDVKGVVSLFLYAAAITASFFEPLISMGLYVSVALMWFIPDPRVTRVMEMRLSKSPKA
ncbi:MAG: TMEM175 family protein [Rickettsiales bacterium]